MSTLGDSLKESKKIILLAFGLLAVSVFGLILTKNGMNNSTNTSPQTFQARKTYSKPEQVLLQGVNYGAIIRTNLGNIELDLFEKDAPIAVNSFLFLAKERFFDNLIFHRVVKGFVIQGGDPIGNGTGGPGYSFQDEVSSRKYGKYTLGMANSGANTNGSQFFITSGNISEGNLSALNGGVYTIFGEVTKGFEVVDSIERVAVDANDKPQNSVVIESIQIIEN